MTAQDDAKTTGEIRPGRQFHLNNRWMRPNVIIMLIANTKYKSHATFSEF